MNATKTRQETLPSLKPDAGSSSRIYLPKIYLPETVKLGSGPIGLFYRGQIRAKKAGIATGMENGETVD